MLRAAGTIDGMYYVGDNGDYLRCHAWYPQGSNGKTHSVVQLEPMKIFGKKFYGLSENVLEWGWNRWGGKLQGGYNPVGPKDGLDRVVRSGCWTSYEWYLPRSAVRYDGNPGEGYGRVGFRLVRTYTFTL